MLFNSLSFLIFLPIIFTLYWSVNRQNIKYQNWILLAASYFFYSCWDWRFLFLLLFSTFLDYYTGIKMSSSTTEKSKKVWYWLSICINLGLLGVFKYYNFFTTSFTDLLHSFGLNVNPHTLNIILPVGISFYTFHGLTYVIDINNGKIKPERNFIDYSLFVSFFPLLVAGPIERATHLLPQIKNTRTFDISKAIDGLRQILWGLFKKIVIADQCAEYVNMIFNNTGDHTGATLVLGAVIFTIQVYCDFSGYSDIALGTARLFGIELIQNFNFPFFAQNISDFWRRWHISLSSSLNDYVFTPLAIQWRNLGNLSSYLALLVTFFFSGLWHGANWTFIVWGLLNAFYIIISTIFKLNKNNLKIVSQGQLFPTLKEFLSMTLTFGLFAFSMIFFRSVDLSHAMSYVSRLFIGIIDKQSYVDLINLFFWDIGYSLPLFIIFFILIEWLGRDQKFALQKIGIKWPLMLRWTFYFCLMFSSLYFSGSKEEFIYFQF